MTTPRVPEPTRCRQCGYVAAQFVCTYCKTPRPGFGPEAESDKFHYGDEAEEFAEERAAHVRRMRRLQGFDHE